MKHPKYYTTSEYIDALTLLSDGNLYELKGHQAMFFSSKEAAEYDAQWLVDFYKKEGKKVKRPVVYLVRFERVKG